MLELFIVRIINKHSSELKYFIIFPPSLRGGVKGGIREIAIY